MLDLENVPGPTLDQAVERALKDPRASGMLVYRAGPALVSSGIVPGDIVISVDGQVITDEPSLRAILTGARRTRQPIPVAFNRNGQDLSAQPAGPVVADGDGILVEKGRALDWRPTGPVATLALDDLTKPHDLFCERWSNAFGTNGKRSRKGSEHHRFELDGATLRVRSAAAFEEFGANRFTAESELQRERDGRIRTRATRWNDTVRRATVSGIASSASGEIRWRFTATDAGGEQSLGFPAAEQMIPSVLSRFAALFLPREEGVVWPFASLPEDAYPWWRPAVKGSFFPLDPDPVPRAIVCRGRRELKIGRPRREAWLFEDVMADRVVASTWVSDEGNLVLHQRNTTLLVLGDPEEVRRSLG